MHDYVSSELKMPEFVDHCLCKLVIEMHRPIVL